MLLLALAAISSLTPPTLEPDSLKPSFDAKMNEGGAAATKIKIVVSPSGLPLRCDVVFKNGPSSNGDEFCAMAMRTIRYRPALDAEGTPVAGVIYAWSQWSHGSWLGSLPPQWDPVDLAFEVNKMPKGFTEMTTFHLHILVGEDGRVAQCDPADKGLTVSVVKLLCDQTSADVVEPARNDRGEAIPSVQLYRVRLSSSSFMNDVMGKLNQQ